MRIWFGGWRGDFGGAGKKIDKSSVVAGAWCSGELRDQIFAGDGSGWAGWNGQGHTAKLGRDGGWAWATRGGDRDVRSHRRGHGPPWCRGRPSRFVPEMACASRTVTREVGIFSPRTANSDLQPFNVVLAGAAHAADGPG